MITICVTKAEGMVRTMTIEQAIERAEDTAISAIGCECREEHRQLAEWLRELVERRKAPEIVRCKNCIYYDPPHVENNGVRYEYAEMPKEAFDELGTGLVNVEYGINVGGRCTRDYNTGYDDDKRVYVPENNYCGRAERKTDG